MAVYLWRMKKGVLLVFSFLCMLNYTYSQGIRGKVYDPDGNELPFAAIGVFGSPKGTASNANGEYSIALPPGEHRVRFQYLGYRAIDTVFHVGNAFVNYRAVLFPEAIELPEAIVNSKGEDPAYTIMRRAIAKAKYHSMQVDEYNAKVYLKGSGRLLKTPWLLRKQINKALAEEGIDSTVAFTQESVSKLFYKRPDQYRDTVISIRTTGNDNNTSPLSFVYSSFYHPNVVNGISPLAPDAFNHYTFEYLGFIIDKGQNVNKIKVTPRGRGDQVFEGVIYIVDNSWSLHSLDLTTYIWGIQFDIQQQFEMVLPDVWMPVHQIYDVSGSIVGFKFEYRYFARLNDYAIKLNPDLEVPVLVIDQKLFKEEAKAADAKINSKINDKGFANIDPGTELSAKQLRKLMKEYEKEQIEALPDADTMDIISTPSVQYIDSSAYKYDSAFWDEVRPLPLTDYEVKGYTRLDSIAALPPKPKDTSDSDSDEGTVEIGMGEDGISSRVTSRKKFSVMHIISGGQYKVSSGLSLKMKGLMQTMNFNTVDGYHGGLGFELGNAKTKKVNWEANILGRYALSREVFNYEGGLKLFGKKWSVQLQGGNNTRQYSYDHPMWTYENAFYTLFLNDNYMKLYEQKFGSLTYKQKLSEAIGFDISGLYAQRHRLVNTTDFIIIDNKRRLYTSNDPTTLEGDNTIFNDHTALITELSVWTKPFWRYRVNRNAKFKDYSRSPRMEVRLRKGWGDDNDPFLLISGEITQKINVGAGSMLSYTIGGGIFAGDDKPRYFHDYAHFPGSKVFYVPFNPVSRFRMLDYYLYSTNDKYVYGIFNYQFRRLLLTQMPSIRRTGIRENVIFNTLLAPTADTYMEAGYAINYLFRIFRVEVITQWQDFTYRDLGIRVGLATDFQSIFRGRF